MPCVPEVVNRLLKADCTDFNRGVFHKKKPTGPCHRPANPWDENLNSGDGSVPKNTQVKYCCSKPVHQ